MRIRTTERRTNRALTELDERAAELREKLQHLRDQIMTEPLTPERQCLLLRRLDEITRDQHEIQAEVDDLTRIMLDGSVR